MQRFQGLILILIVLVASASFADYSGEWVGPGFCYQRLVGTCQMNISIIQTQNNLNVSKLNIFCPRLAESFGPYTLSIKKNELWQENQRVGSYSENYLTFTVPYPQGGGHYWITIAQYQPNTLQLNINSDGSGPCDYDSTEYMKRQ